MALRQRGKSPAGTGRHQSLCSACHSDESFVLRALKAGARGYVLKASPEGDLVNAIRFVHEGKSFFSPSFSRMLVEDYVRQLQDKDVDDSYELLTGREREILQLVAEGKSNKE